MKVVEHTQDAFWGAAQLFPHLVTFLRLSLADPLLVLTGQLNVCLAKVGRDVVRWHARHLEEHRGDQARTVLAREAVEQHGALRLCNRVEDAAKRMSAPSITR